MGVVFRVPPRPLAPFVERLGYYAGGLADGWEPIPPTGTDHLLVNLGSGGFDWRVGAGPATVRVRAGAVVVPGSEGRVRAGDPWVTWITAVDAPGAADSGGS